MSSNIQKRNSSFSSSSRSGKQRIRKCRTRSDNPLSDISFAEARRQVYQALLIHRSRSSFSSASSSSSSSSHNVVYGSSTQLVQSMPTSTEPIWSTTALSLLAHVPYWGATMEVPADNIEFEWGENQASSYSWWLAFLESLDGNKHTAKNVQEEYSKYPVAALGSSIRYFGQRHDGNLKVEEVDEQSSSPDEWLTFPSPDDHEGECNNVIP